MSQLTLHSCGTHIRMGTDQNIVGEITAISIRYDRVTYEVTWWDGANRRSEFVDGSEFSVGKSEQVRIGFIQ